MTLPQPGDPAPLWVAATDANPRFVFGSVAGRYILLGLVGSAAQPPVAAALEPLRAGWPFGPDHAAAFLLSIDPTDRAEGRIPQSLPGLRAVWDAEGAVCRAHGAFDGKLFQPAWLLLDPMLRVHTVMPLPETRAMLDLIERLPPPGLHAGAEAPAPVLVLPRVFEPELCRELIARYRAQGGEVSGFMREENGRTVARHDPNHKIRRDVVIEDEALKSAIQARFLRRIVPEIEKSFQFKATRMERYLVACYAAEEGGHFAAHRDNTTKGTAHRRFAVTINLNAEEFEGGELSFPEFGPRRYRAPTGGCVVFSCSLLHQAHRVTKGERYAFLPFLYDDAAAKIREDNLRYIGEGGQAA
jgi:predicted 2-oxoglutarate/Fe(II)-dependent dioxygenase YbiX